MIVLLDTCAVPCTERGQRLYYQMFIFALNFILFISCHFAEFNFAYRRWGGGVTHDLYDSQHAASNSLLISGPSTDIFFFFGFRTTYEAATEGKTKKNNTTCDLLPKIPHKCPNSLRLIWVMITVLLWRKKTNKLSAQLHHTLTPLLTINHPYH